MKIINLLPREKQRELHFETLYHVVVRAAVIGVALLCAVVLIQVGIHFYLNHQVKTVAVRTDMIRQRTDKAENAELKKTIQLNNAYMVDFENLATTMPQWSRVLLAFARQVPNNVNITQFNADVTTKKIIITGQSPTRDTVIGLYNNISADTKNFYDIDYPLENVATAEDVSFHFTFFIQDDLLK